MLMLKETIYTDYKLYQEFKVQCPGIKTVDVYMYRLLSALLKRNIVKICKVKLEHIKPINTIGVCLINDFLVNNS